MNDCVTLTGTLSFLPYSVCWWPVEHTHSPHWPQPCSTCLSNERDEPRGIARRLDSSCLHPSPCRRLRLRVTSEFVCRVYGKFTASSLIHMTHAAAGAMGCWEAKWCLICLHSIGSVTDFSFDTGRWSVDCSRQNICSLGSQIFTLELGSNCASPPPTQTVQLEVVYWSLG